MLEADKLKRIVQFDIDTKVVGIEFELVAWSDAAIFRHVHGQCRNRAVDLERPVLVAARVCPIIDRVRGGCGLGHRSSQHRLRLRSDCYNEL